MGRVGEWFRRFFQIEGPRPPEPCITREQALEIAREVAKAFGWPWENPVDVRMGKHERTGMVVYQITTNTNYRGGNVGIQIAARDGRVLEAGFSPC